MARWPDERSQRYPGGGPIAIQDIDRHPRADNANGLGRVDCSRKDHDALISRLPEIVLRDVFGFSVPWMPWAVVALSAALLAASPFVAVLQPLNRYFAVMTAAWLGPSRCTLSVIS